MKKGQERKGRRKGKRKQGKRKGKRRKERSEIEKESVCMERTKGRGMNKGRKKDWRLIGDYYM